MSRSRAARHAWPCAWALPIILFSASVPAQPAEAPTRHRSFIAEQLDLRRDGSDFAVAWDATAHAGDGQRGLWLRADGEHTSGGDTSSRLELAWGHALGHRTTLLVGARHDSGTLPSRSYALLGLQSRPGGALEWDLTGYLGDGSQRADVHAGVRTQARYTWQLGDRWSLRGRAEFEYWNEDHERFAAGTGSGPCELRAGLRLGYAAGRRVTWYVGGEWLHQLGDTAELTLHDGSDPQTLGFVAGVRIGT